MLIIKISEGEHRVINKAQDGRDHFILSISVYESAEKLNRLQIVSSNE
jgi:hypothetical protein